MKIELNFLRRSLNKGATIVEYSVLLGLLAVVTVVSILAVGFSVRDSFNEGNTTLVEASETTNTGNPGGGGGDPSTPPVVPTTDPLIIRVNASPMVRLAFGFGVDAAIDWGGPASTCQTTILDGTPLTSPPTMGEVLGGTSPFSISCEYDTPGIYDIKITGKVEGLNSIGKSAGLGIVQWGDTGLFSLYEAFKDTPNLNIMPAAIPETVRRLDSTFAGNTPVPASVVSWNVGNIIRMNGLFGANTTFNLDITSWDMSNVVHASSMFAGATSFNQPIGNWDMGSAERLNNMFYNNTSFNQPLDNWNMSNLLLTSHMFYGTTAFNQSLNSWDMDRVISIHSMFENATAFNGDITGWDLASLEGAKAAFKGATAFRQDLSSWRLPSIKNDDLNEYNMKEMFRGMPSYTVDLRCWNVSHIPARPDRFSTSSPGVTTPLWGLAPMAGCTP